MRPVVETAPLPYPSGRGSDIGTLAGFDQDLVRALTIYLSELARRANYGLNLDGTQTMVGPVGLQSVAYADLAALTGQPGQVLYVTNGRKVGQGAGTGTGVPVYFSSGQWRVFSTDAAVTV